MDEHSGSMKSIQTITVYKPCQIGSIMWLAAPDKMMLQHTVSVSSHSFYGIFQQRKVQ